MAIILDGKKVSAALKEKQRASVDKLKLKLVTPTLAIIRVGRRPEDISYEKSAVKRLEAIGAAVRVFELDAGANMYELLDVISRVNKDESIHGALLFRPLPGHMSVNTVRNALSVEKDIDGISDMALAGVFTGNMQGFAPCTADAVMEILRYYGYGLKGKRVTVIGRSLVIGRPLAMMLMERGATVTICHTGTADLPAACRTADILAAAAGKAGLIGEGCFSPGQVVIDVGINIGEDGQMRGDVDFAAAEPIVSAITPVPGGVGAVTSAMLAEHLIRAAERAAHMKSFTIL